MIGWAIAAGVAAFGGYRVCTKGIPIRSGQLGQPGLGPKWRVRWACYQWKAEIWTARDGLWSPVGDFKSETLAKGAALDAALQYMPPQIAAPATAAFSDQSLVGDEPPATTSFKDQDV